MPSVRTGSLLVALAAGVLLSAAWWLRSRDGEGPESSRPEEPVAGITAPPPAAAESQADSGPRDAQARLHGGDPLLRRVAPAAPQAAPTIRTVAGRVTRMDTGDPIAGALVTSFEGDPGREEAEFLAGVRGVSVEESPVGALTDAEGRFAAPIGAYATRVRLRAVHPSWITAMSDEVEVGESSSPEVRIPMAAGGSIAGEFVGLEPGVSFVARVAVRPESGPSRHWTVEGTRSFLLAGIPLGAAEVEVTELRPVPDDEGGLVRPRDTSIFVESQESRRLVLRVARGITVDVRVTKHGAPVTTADVSLWSFAAPLLNPNAKREDGTYSFRGVPPGKVEVHAQLPFGSDVVKHVDLGEEKHTAVNVEIPASGLQGRVRTAGRVAPPVGLTLWLYPQDRSWTDMELCHVREDGTYSFPEVPPGRYRLVAGNPLPGDGDSEERRVSVLPDANEVKVVDRAVTSFDFEVRPAAAVTVHVVDRSGTPVSGAVVTPMSARSKSSIHSRWNAFLTRGGVTGKAGSVRLACLEEGSVVVFLDQSEYGDLFSDPVALTASTEAEVTLRVGSPARIRLLLTAESSEGGQESVWAHLFRASGEQVPTWIAHATPGAHVALVEPGDYRLTVDDDDWAPIDRTVHVAGPSPQRVRLLLTPRSK